MSDGAAANQALGALTDSVTEMAASEGAAATSRQAQVLLVLRAGSRWLALPAEAVREVVLKGFITRIPLAPPHVLGVTLIRGRLVPVVSLERVLPAGGTEVIAATLPRLVVLETADADAAIVADEVHGIIEFSPESLSDQSVMSSRPAWVAAEITWKTRLLCIVHPARLLAVILGEDEIR